MSLNGTFLMLKFPNFDPFFISSLYGDNAAMSIPKILLTLTAVRIWFCWFLNGISGESLIFHGNSNWKLG